MGFIASFYPFRRISQVREDAELKSFVTTKSGLILAIPPSSDEDPEIARAKQFSRHFPCFRVVARLKAEGQCGGQWSFRKSAHHGASALRYKNLKVFTGSLDDLDGIAFFSLRPVQHLPCCIAGRRGDEHGARHEQQRGKKRDGVSPGCGVLG